jgi:very-short-patch-repair endonuclease
MKKKSKESFIFEAKSKHGDLYLYDEVVYVNNNSKVKIKCKEHGFFEQRPKKHLDGSKCPECSKINISIKMKENFKNGIIKGWHINRDENRRSYPEKFFIEVMNNNDLFKRFKIKEKFSYGKYFIDFLFIELKLIVEIDGEQHFKSDESIKHDGIRDEYFLSEGFKIYRIRWKNLFHNTKSEINEFLSFLNDIETQNYRKYSIENCTWQKVDKKRKYKPRVKSKKCLDCETLINREHIRCRKCYSKCQKNKSKKIKGIKNTCIECGITISGKDLCRNCSNLKQRKVLNRAKVEELLKEVGEIGYSAVGRKYGVSDNCIRKWIKQGSLLNVGKEEELLIP